MPATIFSGTKVKALKSNLNVNDAFEFLSGTDDPSSVAQTAPAGSLYFRTSTGVIYRKTDSGSSTNWSILGNGQTVDNVTIEDSGGLRVKDSGISAIKLASSALMGRHGATYNLGFEISGGDDITFCGGGGAAAGADTLSATNVALAAVPKTGGGTSILSLAANIVFSGIDGAHWGMGTLGDQSYCQLRFYAINDGGTWKMGIGLLGGLTSIASTSTTTTPASCTAVTQLLVNSALSVATHRCVEIGWAQAAFTDAGDTWAISTTINGVGQAPVVTAEESVTVTPSWLTNTTYTAKMYRVGSNATFRCLIEINGGVGTPGNLTLTLPLGMKIDTVKLGSTSAENHSLGIGSYLDAGTENFDVCVGYLSTTAVNVRYKDVNIFLRTSGTVTHGFPVGTPASGDKIHVCFTVPILGWSGN